METINWNEFYLMLPFAAFGFLVHLLTKLVVARLTKDFSLRVFVDQQYLGWLLAWCFCLIGCYAYVRGFSDALGTTAIGKADIVGLLVGITGGSLGKNVVKVWQGLTKKKAP